MRILVLFLLMLVFVGCSKSSTTEGKQIIGVAFSNHTNTLFFSGSIEPLHVMVVPSPADGVVVGMPFQYGEEVQKGQLLFLLSSTKFLSDYKAALLQYVKAKSDFQSGKTQYSEAQFLHKNELISDDDFKTKQANFYGTQLALLQAKDALENLLSEIDVRNFNFQQITIADVDKLTQAMHVEMNANNYLRVIAPTAGVVLAPSKTEEENKKIVKGDLVKQSDVLAVIGDMQGIRVHVKVNELTVNELQIGQKVKVTGIAFSDILQGEVTSVDRQGESSGGGLPTFAVAVSVPKLTPEQENLIHIGMSAKVEIDIKEPAQMMVPINALSEQNGNSFVKLYDDKTGKTRLQQVTTGKTTIDEVSILSGLNVGDKIVVPD